MLGGGRKQLGLFCLATPRCSSWQVWQHWHLGGEVKLQDMLDCHKQMVFSFAPALLPTERTEWHDNASLRGKLQWNGATMWGYEKTCSVSAAPTAQRLSHVFHSDVSTKKVNSKECVWRQEFKPCLLYIAFLRGSPHINLPCFCPWFIDISCPNSRCLKVHWSVRGDYVWLALKVIPSLPYLWRYPSLHR